MSTFSVNPTPTSSSNFQLIFHAALRAYEKRTKRDLLTHPLASQLQTCDSPGSALAVLQGQVDDLDQVRRSDERLTKWLSPTVNVLLAFSAALCEGISLVRPEMISFLDIRFNNDDAGFLTCNRDLCRCWCPALG
jgi:hypothetical protein